MKRKGRQKRENGGERDRDLCLLCVDDDGDGLDGRKQDSKMEKSRGRDENCKGKRMWCRALVKSELTSEGGELFLEGIRQRRKEERKGERGKKGRKRERRKGKGATTKGITRVEERKR